MSVFVSLPRAWMRLSPNWLPPSHCTFSQCFGPASRQSTRSDMVSPLWTFCWLLLNCSIKPTLLVKWITSSQTCSPSGLSSPCLLPGERGDFAQTALTSLLPTHSTHSSKAHSSTAASGNPSSQTKFITICYSHGTFHLPLITSSLPLPRNVLDLVWLRAPLVWPSIAFLTSWFFWIMEDLA